MNGLSTSSPGKGWKTSPPATLPGWNRTWRCAPHCAEYAALCLRGAGQLLRSVAITASPALVASTQARVQARAAQLREHQARVVLIAVSFCLGVLSSTASAWLWWKAGGWVVQRLGLPESIVGPGVLLFWLLPAIVIAVVMLASSRPVLDRSVTMAMLGEREGGRQ